MIKKVILGILISGAAFVFLIFVLFVAYAFYSVKVNEKVDVAAKKFCDSIRVGANIDNVIRSAKRSSENNRLYSDDSIYRFTFSGAIFHASMCTVKTEKGKVVSTELQVFDD